MRVQDETDRQRERRKEGEEDLYLSVTARVCVEIPEEDLMSGGADVLMDVFIHSPIASAAHAPPFL